MESFGSKYELLVYVAATLATILVLSRLVFSRKKLNLPPGPRGWPILGNLMSLGTHPQITLTNMAEVYGPILYLRLGQKDCIVVSSPEMAEEFLKNRDSNFSGRPHMIHADILEYGSQGVGFLPISPTWRHMRNIFQVELTGSKRLEATKHVRSEEAKCMLHTIAQEGLVNVQAQLHVMISNVVSRMILNKRFMGVIKDNTVDLAEAQEFRETIEEIEHLLGVFNIGDFIPALAQWDLQGYGQRTEKLHKHMDKFIGRIMGEHRARRQLGSVPECDQDMVDVLLDKLEGDGTSNYQLSEDNVKAVIMSAFLAASETTTVTIAWTMSEVFRNPSIMKKAQAELDAVVGYDRLVQESDLPNLKYIQCLRKENFRLHPPAPLLIPHESINACTTFGYDIPAKTRLMVNVRAIGRDPKTWDDPLTFNPDRFMEGKYSKMDTHGHDYQLLPFGSGRRSCPGMQMGNAIVPFVVANLLHAFDWSLPMDPKDLDMSEGTGLSAPRAVPLQAIAKPRLAPSFYG